MKTGNDNVERFDSNEEFVDHLTRGDEIEFRYNNHVYMITHPNGKIALYEPYNEDSELQFESVVDFLHHRIGTRQIQTIIKELEILSTLF